MSVGRPRSPLSLSVRSPAVEDLVKALDKFNVPAREKNELLGILGGLKKDIVEVKGQATGTPLPDKFKPAKPISDAEVKAGPVMKKKN